jgi:hypothetical protein
MISALSVLCLLTAAPVVAEACQPDCQGKACGSDGCDSECGVCQSGDLCTPCLPNEGCQTKCEPWCTSYCDQENYCGSDGCGGTCSCGPGQSCSGQQCSGVCQPTCAGKECGSDQCWGSCGSCAPGIQCIDGTCLVDDTCYPNCAGKTCGDDGCGGVCGTGSCPTGYACNNGVCMACQGSCSGKQCGDDGCGGSCGICPGGTVCSGAGLCAQDNGCPGGCAGKVCGDDGCGGTCGSCASAQTCMGGTCVNGTACQSNCQGRQCGDDQCGGLCGTCITGQICNSALGLCEAIDDPGVGMNEACPPGTLYSPVAGQCVYGETAPTDTEAVESACGGAPASNAWPWLLALMALGIIRRRA